MEAVAYKFYSIIKFLLTLFSNISDLCSLICILIQSSVPSASYPLLHSSSVAFISYVLIFKVLLTFKIVLILPFNRKECKS